MHEPGAAQVAGKASSSGGGNWDGLDGGVLEDSRWPRAEEAAPPSPEAAPSAPLGPVPAQSRSGSGALARSSGQAGPARLPFPSIADWEPRLQICTGAGRRRG